MAARQQRNAPGTERTAVYRFHNAAGDLLYIGLTCQLARRLSSHELEKTWWAEVARIDVEHHPTRAEAVEAEFSAIESERPLYNVPGVARPATYTATSLKEAT